MRERSGKPPGRPHDLVESLKQLLDLSQASLSGLTVPSTLRYRILAGITAVAHVHVSGIIELARTGNTWSAEVVLRPLLEGWIVSQYVLGDDADARAASYGLKSLKETKKYLKRMRRLAEENPQDERRILSSAGVSSLNECESRDTQLTRDISQIEEQYGTRGFPSLENCARSLGWQTEWTYASVYSFLLSAQVHVGFGVTLPFVQPPIPDTVQARAEGMHRVVITAYMLYLDLLRMTSAHLGRPSSESLAPFDDVLAKHRPA
jgi:hypothetical protein